MATFQEVIAHIKSNYVAEDMDGGLKLEFNNDGGRTQLVFVFGQPDSPFLVISSPFAQNVGADAVLQIANDSVFGVKKFGDMYTLQHVVPLSDVDASEVEFGLKMVALAADELESKFGGDRF